MERVSDERLAEISRVMGNYAPEEDRSIIRELQERRAAERWIPVTERLPEPRVWVLGITWRGAKVIQYEPDCACSSKWHGDCGNAPTFWMPLPAPPEAK